jgi:hypothetical protein
VCKDAEVAMVLCVLRRRDGLMDELLEVCRERFVDGADWMLEGRLVWVTPAAMWLWPVGGLLGMACWEASSAGSSGFGDGSVMVVEVGEESLVDISILLLVLNTCENKQE